MQNRLNLVPFMTVPAILLNPITAAIGESIKHLFDYSKAYEYELIEGQDILDYNIEQQAAIIEDYYCITFAKVKPYAGRMKNNVTGSQR